MNQFRRSPRFNAAIIQSKLHLDPLQRQQKVVCPFHVDSSPSMSIDLDKGVFYCFGGCAEPKGGDGVLFFIKWAKMHEHRTLSRRDALREITQAMRTVDAAELRRAVMERELRLFVPFVLREVNHLLVMLDRAPVDVIATLRDCDISEDETWDLLAQIYTTQTWAECAYETALESRRTIQPSIADLYRYFRDRGWWNPEQQRVERKLQEYHAKERAFDAERRRSDDEPCRRQPVMIRTPIPRD